VEHKTHGTHLPEKTFEKAKNEYTRVMSKIKLDVSDPRKKVVRKAFDNHLSKLPFSRQRLQALDANRPDFLRGGVQFHHPDVLDKIGVPDNATDM